MQFRNLIRRATASLATQTVRPAVISHPSASAPPAVEAAPATPVPNLDLAQIAALERRFPELRAFDFQAAPENASAILDFYNAYLPIILPDARGAHLRSLLTRLLAAAPDLADSARDAIARSDLAEGLPDRAQRLKSLPQWADTLKTETAALEAAYGGAHVSQEWPNASRGASLQAYLEHSGLLDCKDVLHIAPEDELRAFGVERSRRYVTLDGTPGNVDEVQDLAAMTLPDQSFDVILCHRVLEHVLDDLAAMRHMARILRPGGILNLSVPQSVHRDATAEWVIPDLSHHHHVRQYGRDLAERLSASGFEVSVEPWLLQQPREWLLSRCAYPMRLYNCQKI